MSHPRCSFPGDLPGLRSQLIYRVDHVLAGAVGPGEALVSNRLTGGFFGRIAIGVNQAHLMRAADPRDGVRERIADPFEGYVFGGGPCDFPPRITSSNYDAMTANSIAGLPISQRLIGGDDVQQFGRDRGLPKLPRFGGQSAKMILDISLGHLHRRQSAGIFARQRFGKCAK